MLLAVVCLPISLHTSSFRAGVGIYSYMYPEGLESRHSISFHYIKWNKTARGHVYTFLNMSHLEQLSSVWHTYNPRAPPMAGVVGTAAALRCLPLKDRQLHGRDYIPYSQVFLLHWRVSAGTLGYYSQTTEERRLAPRSTRLWTKQRQKTPLQWQVLCLEQKNISWKRCADRNKNKTE